MAFSSGVVWVGLAISLIFAVGLFVAWRKKAPRVTLLILGIGSVLGLIAAVLLPLVDVVTVYSSGEGESSGD